jgi:hypothetical protein
MMRSRLAAVGIIMVGALGGGGCDDTGTGTSEDLATGVPHNFQQINTLILQPLCGNFSTCHSSDGKNDAGHLDLAGSDPGSSFDTAYDALVGVPSYNMQAMTEGKLRVKPCDPDNSFMWIKLNLPVTQDLRSPTGAVVGYGASMPKDNPHLPPEMLNAIHDWIARGAHQNEPDDVTGATCTTDDAAVPDDLSSHD